MKFLTTLLLVVAGVTASAQTYIDFRKPMRLLYGGDTLIISLQGDSVIFSGKAAELVLRDSTLLEIIQAHGGGSGGGTGNVVSEANVGGSFAVFRTADTITALSQLDNFNLLSLYGVGVGTVDANTVYIQSTSSGKVEVRNELAAQDSIWLIDEGAPTDEQRIVGLSKTGKLKSIKLPTGIQIEVSSAALTTGGESGYIFAIPEQLAGMNLIKMEAYPGEVTGDQTALAVTCYRRRSGTEVSMTSTGASFSTNAVINTSNDDVARGDQLEFRWTFSGGSTAPTGLIVQLTFQKP